jgi:PAS domain S-box-containing protein
MNDSEKIRARAHVERYVWILAVVWTVIIAASLVWNVIQVRRNTLGAARIQARAAFEKDVIYRRWNAEHGGVYALVTEETRPNPYLKVSERDVMTPLRKPLTLINPAYMTRQVHELAEQQYGIRGHITSLNPIRPDNAPGPWETEALQAFERGETEVSLLGEMKGKEYMRLMRPLTTEKGCLKCHAAQGYQEGDIRGGISVSVPMEPLWAIAQRNITTLAVGHILLWLIGLSWLILGTQQLRWSERERNRAEEKLKKYADELSKANQHLREQIEGRKRVEDALRESENSLAEAQRVAHMGNWDLDIIKDELRWSDEIYRIFGLKPQEFGATYEAFLNTIHPDDREFVDTSYTKSVKSNTPYDIVHRIVRPDGEVRYVHEKAEDIKDETGKTIRSIGTVQDITERKKAEDALKKSTAELRTMVNAMAGREIRMAELKEAIQKLRTQVEEAGLIPEADDPLKEI